MTDQTTSDAAASPVCPWCSAALPNPGAATCPSCGAALTGNVDETLPGLTTIDAGAIVRAKQTAIRPRSRLLSWLSGDDGDEVFTKAEGNALEPPDLDVKREMFRIELEGEVANLQAENEAIMAEAVAEGRVLDVPPELADAAGITIPTVDAAGNGDDADLVDAAGEAEVDTGSDGGAHVDAATDAAADAVAAPAEDTSESPKSKKRA